MTKEELATRLNGRQYASEMTEEEERLAKESRLVVIFGASDDLCELRGAIYDEVGACNGCELLIGHDGTLLPEIERDDIKVLEKYKVLNLIKESRTSATKISVEWCKTGQYSWYCSTAAPHAAFDVMEDDQPFCRGLVLDLKDAQCQNK